MSTPISQGLAGSINARFHAFKLPHADITDIRRIAPSFIILDVPRYCGHSPRDTQNYRTVKEIEKIKERDWLA